MTRGSCMGSLSESGPAGIPIQDCFSAARELRLAWALESAISAGFAGGGTTWGLTGITTMSFLNTTLSYSTTEYLPITTPFIAAAPKSNISGDLIGGTDFRG